MLMSIKIAVLIPAGISAYNDMIHRAIEPVIPEDVVVEVFNLPPAEAHECIQGRVDLTHNGYAAVKKAAWLEQEGFKGIFLCDFDMCGVEAAREVVDIPIIGGFTAAAFTALALSQRFSIITILDSTIAMQRDHAYRHGMMENLVSIHSIGEEVGGVTGGGGSGHESQKPHTLCFHPPFRLKQSKGNGDSGQTDKERVLQEVFEKAKIAVNEDGAQSILLGCTGFVDVAAEVSNKLELEFGFYIPVIDTNHAGFSFLVSLVRMGLRASRKCYRKNTTSFPDPSARCNKY